MNSLWKKIFFIFVILLLFSPSNLSAGEKNDNELPEKLSDIETQIKETEAKISQLQEQERTLASQIVFMDSQIKLTTLKIAQNKEKIVLLQKQIEDLGNKIFRLEESLDYVSNLLLERISRMYRIGKIDPLILLLSSEGFSDFINRLQYLRVVQIHDKKLLVRMETTKGSYKEQKNLLEEKEKQVVALKKQLEGYGATLTQQKKDKEILLEVTRNDEKKYQQLLASARAELEAIQAVLAGKGDEINVGGVNQGDRIASIIQGESCNSSGTHLHFTVRKGGVVQNPFDKLKSGIDFENCSAGCNEGGGDSFNPSGDWDWPISPKIIFNQGYGVTYAVQHYSWIRNIYSSHNGIDINSESSSEVKAIKSGTLYRGTYSTESCTLRYVRVDHKDSDFQTYYYHVNYLK